MNANTEKLNSIIESFLHGNISAVVFEKEFTAIFDFEDLGDQQLDYFSEIRRLLERYTPYSEDLRLSRYFINDKQLIDAVAKLKTN